jgi:hypothetical protein
MHLARKNIWIVEARICMLVASLSHAQSRSGSLPDLLHARRRAAASLDLRCAAASPACSSSSIRARPRHRHARQRWPRSRPSMAAWRSPPRGVLAASPRAHRQSRNLHREAPPSGARRRRPDGALTATPLVLKPVDGGLAEFPVMRLPALSDPALRQLSGAAPRRISGVALRLYRVGDPPSVVSGRENYVTGRKHEEIWSNKN